MSRLGRKKILVVNPPVLIERNFIDYPYFANLGALQHAAALKERGFDVAVADAFSLARSGAFPAGGDRLLIGCGFNTFFKAMPRERYDAVAVCLTVFHRPFLRWKFTREFLRELRKNHPGVPMAAADAFFGGMHYVDYRTDDFFANYPWMDALFRYESEEELAVWAETAGAGAGSGETRAGAKRGRAPDAMPFPAWETIDVGSYFSFLSRFFPSAGRLDELQIRAPYLPVVTSRGCPFRCSFCSNSTIAGNSYRKHTPEHLSKYFARLRAEYGVSGIAVLDGAANADRGHFEGLLDAAEASGLEAAFPNGLRADRLTRAHVKRLKNLCPFLSISVESGSERVRERIIGKKLDIAAVGKAAAWCGKENLPLRIHFMIGLPGETRNEANTTLRTALDFAERRGATPLMQFWAPLPGTPLAAAAISRKDARIRRFDEKYFGAFYDFPSADTPELPSRSAGIMMESFRSRLTGLAPEKLIINLTYRCNNRCVMCAVGDRPKVDADPGRCAELLREYHRRGVRLVDFDGGEPTLRKDLFGIIRTAKNIGYSKISVTTNGRRASSESYASRLMDTGLTDLLVSLYGHTAEAHERVTRIPSSFRQTITGIENILELKPPGLHFSVNTVIMKSNYMHIEGLAAFLADAGVENLNIQFPTPFGRARFSHFPPVEKTSNMLSKLHDEYRGRLEIQVINLPPCALPGKHDIALFDAGKYARHMAFIDTPPENLATYLARRRSRTRVCGDCSYYIICEGPYFFLDGKRKIKRLTVRPKPV
ncbi:MAG: radical SAM protein [bacterium]